MVVPLIYFVRAEMSTIFLFINGETGNLESFFLSGGAADLDLLWGPFSSLDWRIN
jgi:hypothetical protein